MKKIISILSILCLLLALIVVPSSAAGEPSEGGGSVNVIPRGVYRFNDSLVDFPSSEVIMPIEIVCEAEYEGVRAFGLFKYFRFWDSNEGPIVYFGVEGILPLYVKDMMTAGTETTFYRDGFTPVGELFGKTFTVLNDTVVEDPVAYSWFDDNTTPIDDPPSDDDFVIYPGEYTARDSIFVDLSLLPSAALFEFESAYSDVVMNGYQFSGMSFSAFNNNFLRIDYGRYGDDGIYEYITVYFNNEWQDPDYTTVEITSSVVVSSAFYEMFNAIFEYSGNSYELGYRDGYNDGYFDGHNDGYNEGYFEGFEDGDAGVTWFGDIIGDVLSALDKFVIFSNFSLLDLYSSILGVFALTWLLKLLAGG